MNFKCPKSLTNKNKYSKVCEYMVAKQSFSNYCVGFMKAKETLMKKTNYKEKLLKLIEKIEDESVLEYLYHFIKLKTKTEE